MVVYKKYCLSKKNVILTPLKTFNNITMKYLLILLVLAATVVSCKEEEKQPVEETAQAQEMAYASFGEKISENGAISANQLAAKYESMTVGDSMEIKVMTKIDDVCQAKGCWMKVDLENGEQAIVKFKDYGFFMPKDSKGKDVIINGKAFVNEVPVDEQRHYAEDGGATAEEIAAITEPKITYSFEADGVLLKTE